MNIASQEVSGYQISS